MDAIKILVHHNHMNHIPQGHGPVYRIYNDGEQTVSDPYDHENERLILSGIPDTVLVGLDLPCRANEKYSYCVIGDNLIADRLHHMIVSAIVNNHSSPSYPQFDADAQTRACLA